MPTQEAREAREALARAASPLGELWHGGERRAGTAAVTATAEAAATAASAAAHAATAASAAAAAAAHEGQINRVIMLASQTIIIFLMSLLNYAAFQIVTMQTELATRVAVMEERQTALAQTRAVEIGAIREIATIQRGVIEGREEMVKRLTDAENRLKGISDRSKRPVP